MAGQILNVNAIKRKFRFIDEIQGKLSAAVLAYQRQGFGAKVGRKGLADELVGRHPLLVQATEQGNNLAPGINAAASGKGGADFHFLQPFGINGHVNGRGEGHGRLKDKPDAVDGGGGEGLVHGISRRGVRFRFSRLPA